MNTLWNLGVWWQDVCLGTSQLQECPLQHKTDLNWSHDFFIHLMMQNTCLLSHKRVVWIGWDNEWKEGSGTYKMCYTELMTQLLLWCYSQAKSPRSPPPPISQKKDGGYQRIRFSPHSCSWEPGKQNSPLCLLRKPLRLWEEGTLEDKTFRRVVALSSALRENSWDDGDPSQHTGSTRPHQKRLWVLFDTWCPLKKWRLQKLLPLSLR